MTRRLMVVLQVALPLLSVAASISTPYVAAPVSTPYVATPGTATPMSTRMSGSSAMALAPVERELRRAVAATFQRNVFPRPIAIYPSRAYTAPYLRDAFWAAQALDRRRYSLELLRLFATRERADGDPPTSFLLPYRDPSYHDDESAALVLIWAYRNDVRYGVTPPRRDLRRALSYLLHRAPHGYLLTPPGVDGSWWDAYRQRHTATLSYNQGLYVVALRSAQALDLRLPPHAVAEGEMAYRSLYNRRLGYLPVSTWLPASDASALTGEFLSLWLFNHPMLSTADVLSTLRHLTPFGAGFCVVTLPGKDPREGTNFPYGPGRSSMGQPGYYQNGASWLLYDALTLGAAGLHGWTHALNRLRARLTLEFYSGPVLHEFLVTNPALPYYAAEPPYRDMFSWDTFVLVIDRVLRAHARVSARRQLGVPPQVKSYTRSGEFALNNRMGRY